MKLDIKNLGYVKSVQLDLDKDLTILCGPNNTGKTYVAYAVYGLMKYRSQIPKIKMISDALEMLVEKAQVDLDIIEILEESKTNFLNVVGEKYASQIHRVFASNEESFSNTNLKIELEDIAQLKKEIYGIKIHQVLSIGNAFTAKITKEKGTSVIKCLLIEEENVKEEYLNEIPTSFWLGFIEDRLYDAIIRIIFPKPYIVPAERNAINIFSKELSLKRNVLVDKLLELNEEGLKDDPFDLINRRATRYPMPIRDSLEISEDLNNYKKTKSDFEYFAAEIEREILKGQVLISKDGDVQFKPEKSDSLKLPIHLSASVVKSLSNLVIYFRHIATKGDFIIIDEPELNLHPDNQVIIARIIAKIVNKGFKVLISTHSDYIVRELNNLIMLNEKPALQKKYKDYYSQDTLLDYKKVSAILFHYETQKGVALDVDETEFEVETIDAVINALNERSQDLYFSTE